MCLKAACPGNGVSSIKIEDAPSGDALPAAAGKGPAVISCLIRIRDVLRGLAERRRKEQIGGLLELRLARRQTDACRDHQSRFTTRFHRVPVPFLKEGGVRHAVGLG